MFSRRLQIASPIISRHNITKDVFLCFQFAVIVPTCSLFLTLSGDRREKQTNTHTSKRVAFELFNEMASFIFNSC